VRLVSEDHQEDATIDGRNSRWDNHRHTRRRELARAARKAIHHQGPDVSMSEIAAAAQTSKSIFYRYFADKTGLQAAIGELVVADIGETLKTVAHQEKTPQDSLRAMINAYVETITNSPHVYRFVTQPSTDAAAPLGNFLSAITDLVAAPFRQHTKDPQQLEAWASGVVGFVRGIGDWWLTSPEAMTQTELVDFAFTSLWFGTQAPNQTPRRP